MKYKFVPIVKSRLYLRFGGDAREAFLIGFAWGKLEDGRKFIHIYPLPFFAVRYASKPKMIDVSKLTPNSKGLCEI